MINLFKHQKQVLLENPPRILLAHSTGTGKTLTGISLAEKNAGTVLVVVPKMLKEKWARDIKAHGKNAVYTIYSKEEFKKYAKILRKFDCVLIDEAHYFAGLKSQLYKSMAWYMKKYDIQFRYLLTATPYLSSPLNILALARLLGYDWNYKAFVNRFFWQIQMGHRVIMKPKPGIEADIASLVAKIGNIVDMEEIVDVPEQTHVLITFPLSEEQKLAKQEYAYTESTHIEQWTTEHQIENGFVYTNGTDFKMIENTEKIAYLGILIKKHKKLAIFCRYKAQIEMVKYLIQANKPVFELHGDIKNRDEVIRQANESKECVIIIQSACSVGYELPTFDTIVFLSLSFSYTDTTQAMGRFLRINNLHENNFIFLITEGVDQAVYDSFLGKRDFDWAIYGKKTKTI